MDAKTKERLKIYYEKRSKDELIDELISHRDSNIDKEVSDMVKETYTKEIKEIIKKNIEKRILDTNYIDKYLFDTCWDGSINYDHPREIFNKVFESTALDENIQNAVKEKFKEILITNMDVICKKVMLNMFITGLTSEHTFQREIRDTIQSEIDK